MSCDVDVGSEQGLTEKEVAQVNNVLKLQVSSVAGYRQA